MPEAARHASALLSLPPSHAACRSGDVGATLQQQQRVTSAIRAGTASLNLLELPDMDPEAIAISNNLRIWVTTSLTNTTLMVSVFSREGTVCQWAFEQVCSLQRTPVFSYDDSVLAVTFTQASATGHAFNAALISLTQPDQQPRVVRLAEAVQAGVDVRSDELMMQSAPSADLFVVCSRMQPTPRGEAPGFLPVLISFLRGHSSVFVQHQAPASSPLAYVGQQLFSPDSRYLFWKSREALHCLEIQTSVWHHLQQPIHSCAGWLQLPACTPRLVMGQSVGEDNSMLLITAPWLGVSHTQPLPFWPTGMTSALSLMSCTDREYRYMRIFRVLPDAPSEQPFLCLLCIFPSDYSHYYAMSPDGCLLLCCYGRQGDHTSCVQLLAVQDMQSSAEIGQWQLQAAPALYSTAWSQQGIRLGIVNDGQNYRLRAACWVM